MISNIKKIANKPRNNSEKGYVKYAVFGLALASGMYVFSRILLPKYLQVVGVSVRLDDSKEAIIISNKLISDLKLRLKVDHLVDWPYAGDFYFQWSTKMNDSPSWRDNDYSSPLPLRDSHYYISFNSQHGDIKSMQNECVKYQCDMLEDLPPNVINGNKVFTKWKITFNGEIYRLADKQLLDDIAIMLRAVNFFPAFDQVISYLKLIALKMDEIFKGCGDFKNGNEAYTLVKGGRFISFRQVASSSFFGGKGTPSVIIDMIENYCTSNLNDQLSHSDNCNPDRLTINL